MHVLEAIGNHPRLSSPQNVFAEVDPDPEIDTVDLLIRSNDGKYVRGVFSRSDLTKALELPTVQRHASEPESDPNSDLLGYAVVVQDMDLSAPTTVAAGLVRTARAASSYAEISNLMAGERPGNRTKYIPVAIRAIRTRTELDA